MVEIVLEAMQKVFTGNAIFYQTCIWAHVGCQQAYEPFKEYKGDDGKYGWWVEEDSCIVAYSSQPAL